ncbi:hypothetical protein ASPZODRAFT_146128 [Penicilliopsis zonata CBS 506.65]|uniref:RRM domain-containing protein n=1 Tax=Penicilliopsis zonata CBS 506.65 TaxID=1073090 RepID=A0A1L9S8D1_9EURO|nr:hypothetical protein ASPZODRAFT_146128 [Penicilliopsis zonata CBS 506.65]OJJ43412.1 hypothetical protein ASPZODRAFT_146128 [Penicilliopsis zonata CBS 506.65]
MTITTYETFPQKNVVYPCRHDRKNEKPSAKNAQGLFPPDACVFVGNLSTEVPPDKLVRDLEKKFSVIGPCHVKVKQDKKQGLPGAFVQFEHIEDAKTALAWTECLLLHKRFLRIEKAKGKRTARFGFRTGAPITDFDVTDVLARWGPIEAFRIESVPFGYSPWSYFSTVSTVTFAYVDDCTDAIRFFANDQIFYLHRLDLDGNPLLPPAPNKDPAHALLPSPETIKRWRDQGYSRLPLDIKCQPTTGRSVEDYVREYCQDVDLTLTEEELKEFVLEVEQARKLKWFQDKWANSSSNSTPTPTPTSSVHESAGGKGNRSRRAVNSW